MRNENFDVIRKEQSCARPLFGFVLFSKWERFGQSKFKKREKIALFFSPDNINWFKKKIPFCTPRTQFQGFRVSSKILSHISTNTSFPHARSTYNEQNSHSLCIYLPVIQVRMRNFHPIQSVVTWKRSP